MEALNCPYSFAICQYKFNNVFFFPPFYINDSCPCSHFKPPVVFLEIPLYFTHSTLSSLSFLFYTPTIPFKDLHSPLFLSCLKLFFGFTYFLPIYELRRFTFIVSIHLVTLKCLILPSYELGICQILIWRSIRLV